jgi:hypothetical protein
MPEFMELAVYEQTTKHAAESYRVTAVHTLYSNGKSGHMASVSKKPPMHLPLCNAKCGFPRPFDQPSGPIDSHKALEVTVNSNPPLQRWQHTCTAPQGHAMMLHVSRRSKFLLFKLSTRCNMSGLELSQGATCVL